FKKLLADADILLHGYRADALEELGFGVEECAALRPGLIDVSLNAYGWTGPWRNRRGFDSLVQMSSGIAAAGQRWQESDKPVPLPVQALDHATGYLMAATAIRGLTKRLHTHQGYQAKLSLARTAQWLLETGEQSQTSAFAPETRDDCAEAIEQTDWGPALRLRPPVLIDAAPMSWSRPASRLGSAAASWE
ncbi:MAG: CoA transferase, partial [Spongiibacteraceae bacterium]